MIGPFGGWELLIILIIVIFPIVAIICLLRYIISGRKKSNIQQKIEQLANLKEQGHISEEEYEQKKKQLLDEL
jgi:uncharacterized membrane protein